MEDDVRKSPEDYDLRVAVVEVTPELAKQWLGRNRGNRREKPFMVARYARDMSDYQWLLSGEPLIFDSAGDLRNGQNRLRACIEARTSFPVLVVEGVDPEAFKVMDTGSGRSYADVLSIFEPDAQNYTALGALAAMIWRWEHDKRVVGGGQALNPTHAEVIDTFACHRQLGRSVEGGTRGGRNAPIRPPRVGAYLHYRFSLHDPVAADRFFALLTTGRRLIQGGPNEDAVWEVFDGDERVDILTLLLQALTKMETEKSHIDAHKVLYYAIRAWRIWTGLDAPVGKLQAGIHLPKIPVTDEGRAWAGLPPEYQA